MANVIIYKNENGGIEILRPTIKKKSKHIDEISFLKEVAEKTFPNRKYIIETDDFLKRKGFNLVREFRNALTLTDNGIDFDIEKCKQIWAQRIREHRDRQLKELDIEFMQALEDGDDDAKKEISDLKKILRNLPQDFLKFKFDNVYQIKSCWPDILKPTPSFVLR